MSIALLLLILALIVLAWCLYGDLDLAVAGYFTEGAADTLEKAGQWGDSFGAFTALFSALGTIGVVWTLAIQQRSLREQAADLHRQRFEASFFQLLTLLAQVRSELRYQFSDEYLEGQYPGSTPMQRQKFRDDVHGVPALIRARREVQWWIEQAILPDENVREELGAIFTKRVFRRFPGRFGAYYRTLFTILNRIDRDRVLITEEKADYSRLLRAQLSVDEVQLMALNGLTSMSGDFPKLIAKYRMLKYVKGHAMHRLLAGCYPPEASQPRD